MRDHWSLDPHVLHLNHGSFGAAPRLVIDAQRRWREEFEANPTSFIEDRYHDELDRARVALGRFLGADPASLAFVTNATSGVASVVGSLELKGDDEILTTNHAYNACRNTLDLAARRGAARHWSPPTCDSRTLRPTTQPKRCSPERPLEPAWS